MSDYLYKSDRNFNDDIREQNLYYVVTHNDLISKASHALSARELKIMDFVIAKIKPDDDNFVVVETSLYELCKLFGYTRNGKNYSDMAKSIGTLRKKEVLILDEKNRKITQTGWVQSAQYFENGKVHIELSPALAPYLLQLKKNYTQYRLFDTVQLDSKYSIRLYKLMREVDKTNGKIRPVLTKTPKELMLLLGAPKSYTFGQFNQKVLSPAIEEINLKIEEMELEVVKNNRGRRVVQVEVHNRFFPRKKELSKENEKPVPMIRWV